MKRRLRAHRPRIAAPPCSPRQRRCGIRGVLLVDVSARGCHRAFHVPAGRPRRLAPSSVLTPVLVRVLRVVVVVAVEGRSFVRRSAFSLSRGRCLAGYSTRRERRGGVRPAAPLAIRPLALALLHPCAYLPWSFAWRGRPPRHKTAPLRAHHVSHLAASVAVGRALQVFSAASGTSY